jgi:transposase
MARRTKQQWPVLVEQHAQSGLVTRDFCQQHCMGKDVTEKLVFVSATTKVVEHHRLKYACRGCEQNGTPNTLKQASAVLSILPKSYATRSLLSQLIISKYQHGLPLYRQEVILKQLGIQLCRQTMSD